MPERNRGPGMQDQLTQQWEEQAGRANPGSPGGQQEGLLPSLAACPSLHLRVPVHRDACPRSQDAEHLSLLPRG